jgi:type IV pilus assembly protein PilO
LESLVTHGLQQFALQFNRTAVTLNNINVVRGKSGETLALTTTAKTFRYLGEEEMAARKKQEKAKKGAKK